MKKILLLLICIMPIFTLAQSNLGSWYIAIASKKINEKINLHGEVQYRNYNAIGDQEQLLLRTGVGYNLTPNNNNILLGYAYVARENYIGETNEKSSVNEHRIFQQFITKHNISIINLQHRYRFEQRFIEDKDMKLRLRYFLSLNIPLNNKKIVDKTLYLSTYNEIFLNTKDEIFDRNRLYGGLGFKINKNIKVELGYMNQFFNIGGRDQINAFVFINI